MKLSMQIGTRAALTTGLVLLGGSLAAIPAASAETATSPSGMITASVPAPIVAGVASTYTLTITNTTSSPMSGIVASGDLPSGMTLKNINGCARLGGNQTTSFLCTMPNLAAGASENATFSILAATIGTFNVGFTVSGSIPVAGSPGTFQVVGDSVTLAVNVQPGPTDVQVTGSSNNGSPTVGSTFTYTFQVKNNGPLPAFGVTFDDQLPAAVRLGGTATVNVGSCTADLVANSVHCDLGGLAVGQQANVSFSATPTAAGTFQTTGTAAMTGTDSQPGNNSFTVTIQSK